METPSAAVRIKTVLRSMAIQKKDFYREVSPLDRKFSVLDASLFCFGGVAGTHIWWGINDNIELFGSLITFTTMINGAIALASATSCAELASLAPSTGAAYHYAYHTIGEFVAFIVGWLCVFGYFVELVYGCYWFGTFFNNSLANGHLDFTLFDLHVPENLFISTNNVLKGGKGWNFNIMAFVVSATYSICISTAVTGSKIANNIIVIIFILGILMSTLAYWALTDFSRFEYVYERHQNYRFLYMGTFETQICFGGFEVILTLGEEAKNPRETIPKSILYTMTLTYALYGAWCFLESARPAHKNRNDWLSPIPTLFREYHLRPLDWICTVISLMSSWSLQYAQVFCLSRTMYAMSRDGLILKIFSTIDARTKTPIISALIICLFIGICSMLICIQEPFRRGGKVAIEIAYLIANVSLLITRYRCENDPKKEDPGNRWYLINSPPVTEPTRISHNISMLLLFILVLSIILDVFLFQYAIMNPSVWGIKLILVISLILTVVSLCFLSMQPQNDRSDLYYSVFAVPAFPILVIIWKAYTVSTVLIPSQLLVILVWCLLGIIHYFVYSIHNSVESRYMFSNGSKWTTMIFAKDIRKSKAEL